MNPTQHPTHPLRQIAHNRPLMAALATLLALVMLAVYVDLLYGQVERGKAMRAANQAQVTAAAQAPARSVLLADAQADAGSAQARRTTQLH